MNRPTAGLVGLWLILVVLTAQRVFSDERWGHSLSVALLAWLGGVVFALLIQIFLDRNRADW